MAFKFENLIAWQKSLDFTLEVHNLTKKFPQDEKYILTSQIKRAADSINLNIAEGSTGQTDKQFSTFLGYAIRSGIEVVSCLFIARKRELINASEFDEMYNRAEEIIKITQGLRNSIDTNK